MYWVECFVVKNGVCVARSGEFVVNIKQVIKVLSMIQDLE